MFSLRRGKKKDDAAKSASGGAGGGAGAGGSAAPAPAPAPAGGASPAELRVMNDIKELDNFGGIAKLDYSPDDVMNMTCIVCPDSGLWKGVKVKFTVQFGPDYPDTPPKVKYTTKLYHPNLDYTGGVCISLRKDWTCILDTNNIVYRLINLFVAPNPMDPLNTEAAEVMREHPAKFEENVRRSLRGATIGGEKFPRLLK